MTKQKSDFLQQTVEELDEKAIDPRPIRRKRDDLSASPAAAASRICATSKLPTRETREGKPRRSSIARVGLPHPFPSRPGPSCPSSPVDIRYLTIR